MGYTINFGEISVQCDTLDEAHALIERFQGEAVGLEIRDEGSDPWDGLVKGLFAINEAGKGGLSANRLAKWIGLPNGRAMGPRTRVWTRLLGDINFKPEDVWEHRRIGAYQRRWFAGPRIKAALKAAAKRCEGVRD